MRMLDLAVTGLCMAAAVLAIRRWLLVAQREGWAGGAASRGAVRWWTLEANLAVAAVAVASLVVSPLFRPSAVTAALAVAVGPFGLPWRGQHPGPLVWTPRAWRVATIAVVVAMAVPGAGLLVGSGTAAVLAGVVALLAPILVDVGVLAAGGPEPGEGVIAMGIDPAEALAQLVAGDAITAREVAARRVLVAAGPGGAGGEDLAQRATAVATHLLVVGRHARAAWRRGAARGSPGCTIVLCQDIDDAVLWVDAETAPTDTVVWLSVPPDHRP